MTIGVFFGSQSPEHEVSIITGQLIISELLNLGHSVVAIYLTKNRQWLVQKLENPNAELANSSTSNEEIQKLRTGLLSLKTFNNLETDNWIDKEWQNWDLDLTDLNGQLVLTKKTFFKTQKIVIDLAIPALHGSFGEDGTIQGLLEMLKVPYVGSGVTSSSVVMDKILTKIIAQGNGVPTAQFVVATKLEIQNWTPNSNNQEAQTNLNYNSSNQEINDNLSDPEKVSSSKSGLDRVTDFLGNLQKSKLGQKFNPDHLTLISLTNSKAEFVQKVERELNYPVFVKPPRLGSSIGITKAHNRLELEDAIEVCLYYDEQILVEKAVANLADLTCCVIEKSPKLELLKSTERQGQTDPTTTNEVFDREDSNFLPNLQTSLIQESLYSAEMFSFQDKYLNEGGSQTGNNQKALIIPAQIPVEIATQIQQFSKALFAQMNCSGIARFDFLLDRATGQVYFSEVNPLPGNFYKHLWQASGIPFGVLLTNLIQVAEQNHQSQKTLTYTFKSNLIQMANSSKMTGKGKM